MKFLTAILFSFISVQVFADCGQKIIDDQKINGLPADVITCIQQSEGFAEGLLGLCNESKSDYNGPYKKYVDYEQQYNSKAEERDSAQADRLRRILNMELDSILQEWNIYGYRYEMEPYLFSVSSSVSKCARESIKN